MWYFGFSFLINLQKCQQFCVCLSISGGVRSDLRITVRASPSGVPHPSGTPQPAGVPLVRTGASAEWGTPPVSFGASPDDQMSVAASEGEPSLSGDDDSAALPPSGVVALSEPDPEMTAMLSRAAENVGLVWNPPPRPDPSRLDEWFLGGGRAGFQRPPPVPFFPEVHEELTRSWKTPFTARNKPCGSSPLTTLDGGAALGYTGIPSVERSVAMQLCPRAPQPARRRGRPPVDAPTPTPRQQPSTVRRHGASHKQDAQPVSTRSCPSGCPCRLASSPKSWRRPLSPWENKVCALSTTSTTGSYSHSLAGSCLHIGTWCSSTSACWAFGSTGKRANSCQRRGSLFSAWSSIRSTKQHASPRNVLSQCWTASRP